jgi:hypothetical protein
VAARLLQAAIRPRHPAALRLRSAFSPAAQEDCRLDFFAGAFPVFLPQRASRSSTTSFRRSQQALDNGQRTIQVHNLSKFLIEVAQPTFIKHLNRKRRKLEKPRAAPATYTHREFVQGARYDSGQLSDDDDSTAIELNDFPLSPLSSRPSFGSYQIRVQDNLQALTRKTRASAWHRGRLHRQSESYTGIQRGYTAPRSTAIEETDQHGLRSGEQTQHGFWSKRREIQQQLGTRSTRPEEHGKSAE